MRKDLLIEKIINPFRKVFVANKCGHNTTLKGIIPCGDSKATMRMYPSENGRPDYCLECIGKMSTKCAWCGSPILIGETITLYTPVESFEIPEYASRYNHDDKGNFGLVGCLRRSCCQSGADMCGRWMPPGEVERLMSPIEMLMANPDKKTVFVGDCSNYPGTVSLK